MKTIIKSGMIGLAVMMGVSGTAQEKEKKVRTIELARKIDAPADKVWAVVGEGFGDIYKSHPGIVSSKLINGTTEAGEGAERVCNFNEECTKYVHEKQVNYDPDNMQFDVDIFQVNKIPMDPDYSRGNYKITAIDENTSVLTFRTDFRTKPAFMGAVAKKGFTKILNDYLMSIEHHIKTGETITKDSLDKIKKS